MSQDGLAPSRTDFPLTFRYLTSTHPRVATVQEMSTGGVADFEASAPNYLEEHTLKGPSHSRRDDVTIKVCDPEVDYLPSIPSPTDNATSSNVP